MERRLHRVIMTPAMIATFIFGIWMVVLNPVLLSFGWFHLKLTLLVFLVVVHHLFGRWRKNFLTQSNRYSQKFFRIVNEVPTVIMIADRSSRGNQAHMKRGKKLPFPLRRLWYMLSTLFGKPRGVFIPYRYADHLHIPNQEYTLIKQWLSDHADRFLTLLEEINAHYAADLQTIKRDSPPPEPRWNQAVVYQSGRDCRLWSRSPSQTEKNYRNRTRPFDSFSPQSDPRRTSISPNSSESIPYQEAETLPATFLKTFLQSTPLSLFQGLTETDILFVDSSHIGVAGSDVDRLFSEIIPALPKGIHIHFHDVFLPHDYPVHWKNRGYNEQQLIIARSQRIHPYFRQSLRTTLFRRSNPSLVSRTLFQTRYA